MSQEELAEATGATRSFVSDFEKDRSSPTIRTVLTFVSAIERADGRPFGKTEHERLARFFLGPSLRGQLIVAQRTIPLGEGRGR
jgi:transcriptional regulator with XRE-family HTH domain